MEPFLIIIDELPIFDLRGAKYRHDLKSLRLVSREIQVKTRKAYAHEFCERIAVDLARSVNVPKSNLMEDPIFQDSVRELEIHVGGHKDLPENLAAWADEIMLETWKWT